MNVIIVFSILDWKLDIVFLKLIFLDKDNNIWNTVFNLKKVFFSEVMKVYL